MRITEEKLHNFADYIKKFKSKKEAFKQFQQKEIQHIFADNQVFFSSKSRKKNKNNCKWATLCSIEHSPIFPYSLIHTLVRIAMTEQIMTLKEVATYLKLTEKTAYRLAAEKKLPGFKVGGSWRFKLSDLEMWIEQQKDKGWSQITNSLCARSLKLRIPRMEKK